MIKRLFQVSAMKLPWFTATQCHMAKCFVCSNPTVGCPQGRVLELASALWSDLAF